MLENQHLSPRVSLEQWRCLVAVVNEGGYAQAAAALHKSQSAVTYAVQKLESLLDVQAFAMEGRKAVLTPTGQMLYRRARSLVEDATGLERAARKSSAGWEPVIWLAAEILFPAWLMLACLERFGRESPQTRIELLETVLDGTPEALQSGQADLAISPRIPPDFNGEPLMPVRFVPVAHPEHPLHKLGRDVTLADLRRHRHLVVRDSGSQRGTRAATVEVAQRWTMSNMATSIGAACRGYGFAWFPEEKIVSELSEGSLKKLPLRGGRERTAQLSYSATPTRRARVQGGWPTLSKSSPPPLAPGKCRRDTDGPLPHPTRNAPYTQTAANDVVRARTGTA